MSSLAARSRAQPRRKGDRTPPDARSTCAYSANQRGTDGDSAGRRVPHQPLSGADLQRDIEQAHARGRDLSSPVRSEMEAAFGTGLSDVRVHTDPQADTLSRTVQARAFNFGRDIFFQKGAFEPSSHAGRELLAHELTHVVQQRGAPTGSEVTVSEPADASEREADHIGALVARCPDASCSAPVDDDLQRESTVGRAISRQAEAAPAAVPQRIKVWWNSFIPHPSIEGPPGYNCFTGDSRGFSNAIHASSRTHQEIEVDATTLGRTIDWKAVGETHQIDCNTGAVLDTGRAPVSELTNGPVVSSAGEIIVHFGTAAANPLVGPAPAIDSDVYLQVNPSTRECNIAGAHDGFPGYEAYVTADGDPGIQVYGYDPRTAGQGPTALFPPMDVNIVGAPTRF